MVTINNVNFIPASFAEVIPPTSSDLYTRGKLDVFYIGETGDHRLFTPAFSEKLLASLAYTPVVSYYDEEKQDFEGHAAQQNIYGIVDPMVAPTFVEHDGATWARCDVILYTERPDETGDIASKIIGHAQSLELHPDTLKYKINRDAYGNFKNLEFLDGQFVGVSVLGKDQEPAFSGSAFFEKLPLETFIRGKEMNLTIQEFAKLSWGEKVDLLYNALAKEYGENFWMIQDVYDNNVVYTVYTPEDERVHMYRMKYKMTDDSVSFTSEPEEVHPSYERFVESDKKKQNPEEDGVNADLIDEDAENSEEVTPEPEPIAPEPEPEPKPEPTDPEPEPEPESNDPESGSNDPEPESNNSEPEPENGAEEGEPEPEQTEEPNDPGQAELQPTDSPVNEAGQKGSTDEETNSAASTLSDAERDELAAYRKEKKIALIGSYSDMLTKEELDALVEKVDAYTYEALKSELDSLFVAAARRKADSRPAVSTFSTWYPSTPKGTEKSGLAQYIGSLLNK